MIQSTIDENPQKPKAPVPMRTPVPTVLPALNVSPTPVATPSQPQDILSQIRQRAVQKRNIRQRAKENPAIASTLLGGLGSAGLL